MIELFKRLFTVALTEWKVIFRDPAGLLIIGLASILYAFYCPFPYLTQVANDVPAAVVDLDHTPMSRQLIQMSDATQQVDVRYVFSNVEEAKDALAEGKIFGFMVIPEDMEKTLKNGGNTGVTVFTHGAYVMLHGNIGTAFSTCALTLGATTKVRRIAISKQVPAAKAIAMRDPIPLSIQTMYNNTGSYTNFVVPGILMLILQQTLVIGICVMGGSRARRKFRNQFMDSAVENESLPYRYFGRVLMYVLHYCVFLSIYHFVVYPLLDLPRRGDVFTIAIFALVYFFSVANFGMVISQVFLRRDTSMQLMLFLSIPILILSSFSWPSHLIPEWMRAFSYTLPSTLAIPTWLTIEQRGADFYDVAVLLYPLALQAIFYMLLGILLTHLRDGSRLKTGEM